MIYFIYEITSLKPHQRFVEEIGQYDGFLVGTMPESLLERETIPECMVIPKDVALAYKFADRRNGSLNVRPGTTQYDQTDPDRLEPYKDKFKYYLISLNTSCFCDSGQYFFISNLFGVLRLFFVVV